jgi:hypothetical protein
MVLLNLSMIVKFAEDEPRMIKRGEDAVNANHVLQVNLSEQEDDINNSYIIVKGKVQASMRDRIYDCEVSHTI